MMLIVPVVGSYTVAYNANITFFLLELPFNLCVVLDIVRYKYQTSSFDEANY